MNKSIEVSGKTEDEAIASALSQLGLERDEVSVEILERAKSGFLGIGGSPARIRVSYQYEESKEEKVQKFLSGLFERMGVAADTQISTNDEGTIEVVLVGENMGMLIGRRGETLDAIQHLTNYAVNHGDAGRVKINIDAENYRAKRADALKRLAEKVAGKVVKYRKSITLEPMNAYERHVIHTALQSYEGVTTFSTGSEPNRRIVVAYERPNGAGREDSRETRRPRRDSRPSSPARPREEAVPTPAPSQPKYTAREWQ